MSDVSDVKVDVKEIYRKKSNTVKSFFFCSEATYADNFVLLSKHTERKKVTERERERERKEKRKRKRVREREIERDREIDR